MKDRIFSAALVKRLCPICAEEFDAEIVLNKRLTKSQAQKVEKLHGKVVGYTDKVCEKCAKDITKEGVYLIEYDPNKSDESIPFRTGRIIGIKKEAFERIFNKDITNFDYYFTPIEIFSKFVKDEKE